MISILGWESFIHRAKSVQSREEWHNQACPAFVPGYFVAEY